MTAMKAPQLARRLIESGFQPEGGGYCRNSLRACLEPRWLTFRTQADSAAASIIQPSDLHGLWKSVRTAGGDLERVFELPLDVVAEHVAEQEVWDPAGDETLPPVAAVIDWVTASLNGHLPPEWEPPPRSELEAMLPAQALTMTIGPFARQGQLHSEGTHLRIAFPLLSRVPPGLSAPRRRQLSKLLEDIQNRSRLVRMNESHTAGGGSRIVAEMDLSGAPRFAVPRLLRSGVDAIRYVLSRSVVAAELIVDPTVTSTVWEIPSVQDHPAERSES